MPDALAAMQDAALGLCPKCHGRTLFAGLLAFAPVCVACGLDLAQFNVGDGASAFVTLIVGGLVVAGAVWLQESLRPPIWLQLAIWLPVMAIGVIGALRVFRAALLQAEYRTGAREGRLQ